MIRYTIYTLLFTLLVLFLFTFRYFQYEIFPPRTQVSIEIGEKLNPELSLESRPLIYAHRGDHLFPKENSLKAVLRALKKGYDGVELDVQITADGYPVLFHDQMIEIDGLEKRVTEISMEELHSNSIRFSLLDDVLDQAGGKILLLLEMKSEMGDAGGLERVLCDTIRNRKLTSTVILSSTDYFLVQKTQENCPGVKTMFEYSGPPEQLQLILQKPYRSNWISLSRKSLTESLYQWLKKRSYQVSVYTVNEGELMDEMIDWGVDLVQTDFPGTFTHHRERSKNR